MSLDLEPQVALAFAGVRAMTALTNVITRERRTKQLRRLPVYGPSIAAATIASVTLTAPPGSKPSAIAG